MNNLLLKHRSCIFENKSISIQTILNWTNCTNISNDSNDVNNLNSTNNQHICENLNLNPEYQRGVVWSLKKKQKFIDTILLQFPFPNITLLQNTKNIDFEYECVDGKQRLTSIIQFSRNEFKVPIHEESLQNLATYYYDNKSSYFTLGINWASSQISNLFGLQQSQFNKLYGESFHIQKNHKYLFKDLPIKLQIEFKNYEIPCLILKGDWSPECVYDIFQRVQNGVALTVGEMINAQTYCSLINRIKSYQKVIIQMLSAITTKINKNCNWITLILGCVSIHITKDIRYLHASKMINFAKEYSDESQRMDIYVILNFLKILMNNLNKKIDKWDLFLLFYVYDIHSHTFYDFLDFFVRVEKPPEWDFEKESSKTIKKKYAIYNAQNRIYK